MGKGDLQTDNKRDGHFPQSLKSQYGEFRIGVPRDIHGQLNDLSGIDRLVQHFLNNHTFSTR